MLEINYLIECNADRIDQYFINSPFNLHKDIKLHKIENDVLNSIAEQCANELLNCPRPPRSSIEYVKDKIKWGKLRIVDIESKFGTSKGFRVILLIDDINKIGYILHIYKHGKGEKDNISQKEKNALKKLVDNYYEQLNNL